MHYYIPSKLPLLKPRVISVTELFEEVSAGFIRRDTKVICPSNHRDRDRELLTAGAIISQLLEDEDLKWCNHGDPIEKGQNGKVKYRASRLTFANCCSDYSQDYANVWLHGIWPHSFSLRFLLAPTEDQNPNPGPNSCRSFEGTWDWDAFGKHARAEIFVKRRETSDLLKSLAIYNKTGAISIDLSIRSHKESTPDSDISASVNSFTIESTQCL